MKNIYVIPTIHAVLQYNAKMADLCWIMRVGEPVYDVVHAVSARHFIQIGDKSLAETILTTLKGTGNNTGCVVRVYTLADADATPVLVGSVEPTPAPKPVPTINIYVESDENAVLRRVSHQNKLTVQVGNLRSLVDTLKNSQIEVYAIRGDHGFAMGVLSHIEKVGNTTGKRITVYHNGSAVGVIVPLEATPDPSYVAEKAGKAEALAEDYSPTPVRIVVQPSSAFADHYVIFSRNGESVVRAVFLDQSGYGGEIIMWNKIARNTTANAFVCVGDSVWAEKLKAACAGIKHNGRDIQVVDANKKIHVDTFAVPASVIKADEGTPTLTPPSQRQEGGDHYKNMPIQPWHVFRAVFTHEEMRGYHVGTAIAYLMRYKAKGGDLDIRKAEHHLSELNDYLKGVKV